MLKINLVLVTTFGLWSLRAAHAVPFDPASARRRLDVVALQWAPGAKERQFLNRFAEDRIASALTEIASLTPETPNRAVSRAARAFGSGAYVWLAQLSAPRGLGGSAIETAAAALDELGRDALDASTTTPAQRQVFYTTASGQFRIMKTVTSVKSFLLAWLPDTPRTQIRKTVHDAADPELLAGATHDLKRRWTGCAARLANDEWGPR